MLEELLPEAKTGIWLRPTRAGHILLGEIAMTDGGIERALRRKGCLGDAATVVAG